MSKFLDRIDAALAEKSPLSFYDLARKLYPNTKSWAYQRNGGPPGCFISLSAALRRGGYDVSGDVGPGNRKVYARAPHTIRQTK